MKTRTLKKYFINSVNGTNYNIEADSFSDMKDGVFVFFREGKPVAWVGVSTIACMHYEEVSDVVS